MILQVKNLHKDFPLPASGWVKWAGNQDKIRAVNGVSFEVQQGRDPGDRGGIRMRKNNSGPVSFEADRALCRRSLFSGTGLALLAPPVNCAGKEKEFRPSFRTRMNR